MIIKRAISTHFLVSVILLFSILITSCGNAPSSASDTKEDNVSQDNFQGEYVANDSSTLTITENSGKYEIVINIVRLTNIDDGIGEVSTSTSELKFTATDAQGNSIEGKISLVNKDLAVLEFTKSTWEYLPNGTKIEFTRKSVVTESTEGTEYSEEYLYNSQMILFNYDMLDLSISGYQNKIGERYFMHFSEQERLDPYYIKLHDKVKYYYAQEKLVGIDENNEVCLFSCAASKIVGEYAPPVRDVISALGITDMFEIQPDVTVVHNQNNSRNFFYWKISNGYIGFVTIGGNDPSQCYNYPVSSFVALESLDFMNKNSIVNVGDTLTISGVVDYSEEPSDIGRRWCSITESKEFEYYYNDECGEKSKTSSNVFYTKENETDLLKKYVGKQITISGIFETDIHGVPFITNIVLQE